MKGELAAALSLPRRARPARPHLDLSLAGHLGSAPFFSRTGALEERGPKRGVRRFRASLPGVYFQGDERLVAVVFIGRHHPMR
ncbi:MAG: hypothetical protein WBP15_11400, partial [Tabrizicola sp.]